jgi:hypothetical protein
MAIHNRTDAGDLGSLSEAEEVVPPGNVILAGMVAVS